MHPDIHTRLLNGDVKLSLHSSTRAIAIMQRFARRFLSRKKQTENAFFAGAEYGIIRSVTRAIEAGQDVNARNPTDTHGLSRTALHYAAGLGNDELVGILIGAKAECLPDSKQMTPVHYACQNTPAFLASLEEKSSEWKASYSTNLDMPWSEDALAVMLAEHFPVNSKNDNGQTPLHLACSAGLGNITLLLCEHKADVDIIDNLLRTPMHLCAWGGHLKCVEQLIRHKAFTDVVNVIGRTPLHVASVYGHTEVCEALIKAEASLDAVNHNLNTPLHLALLDGFKETAETLIDAGAETSLPNKNGDTALGICVEKYSDLALKILDKRRKLKGGPTLFGDTVAAMYDFTGIDDDRCQPVTVAVEIRGIRSLQHPHSALVKEKASKSHITMMEDIPVLKRKSSSRDLEPVCAKKTPLFRMAFNNNRDLVCHPVIIQLLERKWDSFAKLAFREEVSIHVVLSVLWIIGTVAWGPAIEVTPYQTYDLTDRNITHPGGLIHALVFWIFFTLCAALFSREMYKLLRTGRGALSELRSKDAWWMYDVCSLIILLTWVLSSHIHAIYMTNGDKTSERASMAVGSLLLWARFLQFLAAYRLTGPFVKILTKMVQDMINFVLVYCVILLGFSHAFFMVLTGSYTLENPSLSGIDGYSKFTSSILSTFRCMVGDFGYSNFDGSDSIYLATVLYVSYTIIATILMLNLIVAMLNETYSMIKYDSAREWRLEWAKRILKIESGRTDLLTGVFETTEAAPVVTKETKQEKSDKMIGEIEKSLATLNARVQKQESSTARINDKLDLLLTRTSQVPRSGQVSNQGSFVNGTSPTRGIRRPSLQPHPHALMRSKIMEESNSRSGSAMLTRSPSVNSTTSRSPSFSLVPKTPGFHGGKRVTPTPSHEPSTSTSPRRRVMPLRSMWDAMGTAEDRVSFFSKDSDSSILSAIKVEKSAPRSRPPVKIELPQFETTAITESSIPEESLPASPAPPEVVPTNLSVVRSERELVSMLLAEGPVVNIDLDEARMQSVNLPGIPHATP